MKKLISALLFFTFIASVGLSKNTYANRAPSINEFQEIDMEQEWKDSDKKGFNFDQKKPVTTNQTASQPKKSRYPANSKYDASQSSGYYIGPIFFLLALPLAFWILMSKKLKSEAEDQHQSKFFNKTIQFKPYQTDYQKNDDDDDDISQIPKAS